MNIRKHILFWLIVLPLTASAQYYTSGTDFWLAFMQNYGGGSNIEYKITLTNNNNTAASCRITAPTGTYDQTINLAANTKMEVLIPRLDAEIMGSGTIVNKGFHVTSNLPINAFVSNFSTSGTAEASIVLPFESLADNYTVLSYNEPLLPPGAQIPGATESAFLVVATEDSTTIEINPTSQLGGVGTGPGTPFQIMLMAGQAIQYKTVGTNTTNAPDLTGTTVKLANTGTCKSFAVFTGHTGTYAGGCRYIDNLMEQMIPRVSWGNQYVLPHLVGRSQVIYRILADQPCTVTLDGFNHSFPRPDGSWYLDTIMLEVKDFTDYQWLTSTQPVAVAQINTGEECDDPSSRIGGADPFMIIMASTDRMLADEATIFTVGGAVSARNYLAIVTADANTGTIQLNGTPVTGWEQVHIDDDFMGPVSGYSVARMQINNSITQNTITGTDFTAYVYGYNISTSAGGGSQNAYGYLGAASFNTTPPLRVSIASSEDPSCHRYGDGTVTLSIGSGVPPYIAQIDTLGAGNVWVPVAGGSQTLNAAGTLTFSGLYGDYDYRITVTDVSCNKKLTLNLNDPAPIQPGGTRYPSNIVQYCASTPIVGLPDALPAGGTWSGLGVVPPASFSPPVAAAIVGLNGTLQLDYTVGSCTEQLTVQLKELCEQINVHNVFTPNGDGINDTWKPIVIGASTYTLKVYTRYGNLVFETNNPDEVWKGDQNGADASAGTYFFALEATFENGQHITRSGNVTLLR